MKKNTLLIFSLLCISFLFTGTTKASTKFSITYGEDNFIVNDEVFSSWQGQVRLPAESNIIYKPSLESLMATYAGINFPTKATYVIYPYQPKTIYDYVKNLAIQINLPVKEPEIIINGKEITVFSPPRDGLAVDTYGSTFKILKALQNKLTKTELVVTATKPGGSLAALNNLGINELVAKGQSNFKGSPNNRRHNIKVGVSKVTGVLIAPGEEFSFNKYLGPVEAEEGFLPELVIKRTGTVPELGGGLCQVSSTVFRAAINAGLPITQRRNHSYAVQYYAPQGTDATIYPGVIDLKFKNDTPAHLLLWAYFKDKDTLVYELYGTKDTRQITVYTPEQYEKKPDGSMKATWKRDVTKNGVTRNDVFNSVYQPPALFHKEEQFVNSSGQQTSPTSTPATVNIEQN